MWISASERKPTRRELCDFLYGEDEIHGVWMLCSAYLGSITDYLDGDQFMYWRPTEPLPPGVIKERAIEENDQ